MKRALLTALLAASPLTLGTTRANALFEPPNASAQVAFYHVHRAGTVRPLASVRLNNSPVATVLEEAKDATHVALEYGGQTYTFSVVRAGDDKFEIMLNLSSDEAAPQVMSLAEVLETLAQDPDFLEALN